MVLFIECPKLYERLREKKGQRLIEFCQENALVIANTLFQQHKRRRYTWTYIAGLFPRARGGRPQPDGGVASGGQPEPAGAPRAGFARGRVVGHASPSHGPWACRSFRDAGGEEEVFAQLLRTS